MEKVSIKIADILLRKHYIEKPMYNIYRYGMQMVLEIGVSFITSIVICCLCKKVVEGIIFFAVFIPLRSFLGGYHMKSYVACYLLSCATLTVALWMGSFEIKYGISWLILVISIIIVLFEAKRERLKDIEGEYFYPRICVILISVLVAGFVFTILSTYSKLFLLSCTTFLVAMSKLLENMSNRFRKLKDQQGK